MGNVNQFFARQKARVCTCREFTDFVLNYNLKTDEEEQEYLENLFQKILDRGELSEKELLDDQVFKEQYISSRLDQIKLKDAEKDLPLTKMGETSEILYATAKSGLNDKEDFRTNTMDKEPESESTEDDDQEENDEERIPAKHREKEVLDKKAHKKEAKKERRKTKTPKHVKKRKEKIAKTKK